MSMLSQIIVGKQPAPRRAMIYGVHGVGKSSFAACSDRPVFVQTEDGLAGIACEKFPLATSLDDVIAALAALYTEEHNYRTVVVDSLDWLEQLIWQTVCTERSVASMEDVPYGKAYVFAVAHWRKFLEGLDALRNDRGMTIVMIAHSQIARFEDPAQDSYDRYCPRLHKLASALVQEWADEVLFASYKVHIKQTDEGFNRVKTRGLGTGERILRTTERPSHVAKNRLNLPDELTLDWNEYAKYFDGAPIPNASENGKDTQNG